LRSLALLLCGYSVFSAVVLAATHFRSETYLDKSVEQALGLSLVAGLGGIQALHFAYLMGAPGVVQSGAYQALLFAIAPLFYLFCQPLMLAQLRFAPLQAAHLLPVFAAPWLSPRTAWVLAFSLGALYLLGIARQVYALRAQRHRFHLELGFLAGVFAIALAVVGLVLLIPLIAETQFFALYAGAIGCAFLLINLALFYAPQLPESITEAASETYVASTLGNVDCVSVLQALNRLMVEERLFENPDLDLTGVSQRLGLSTHQLSELVNAKLGKGFSRYVREQRVAAARIMLLAEPQAAVLAVGMNCGFSSQSNFYSAFREVTGMTPGQFRKISLPE